MATGRRHVSTVAAFGEVGLRRPGGVFRRQGGQVAGADDLVTGGGELRHEVGIGGVGDALPGGLVYAIQLGVLGGGFLFRQGVFHGGAQRAERAPRGGALGFGALEFLVGEGDVEDADGDAFGRALEAVRVDDVEVVDDLDAGRAAAARTERNLLRRHGALMNVGEGGRGKRDGQGCGQTEAGITVGHSDHPLRCAPGPLSQGGLCASLGRGRGRFII